MKPITSMIFPAFLAVADRNNVQEGYNRKRLHPSTISPTERKKRTAKKKQAKKQRIKNKR